MPAQLTLASSSRFVRRTHLHPDEQRINFTQVDNDVLDLVASDEAAAVTPHMNRIYTRLLRAPAVLWERVGVLHLTGEDDEQGGRVSALDQLARLCGVARATVTKAMRWLHEQGVIGYDARKNGVGIRIFINRAAASIRKLPPAHRAPQPVRSTTTLPPPPAPRPVEPSPIVPIVISPAVEPTPPIAAAATLPVRSSTDDARSSSVELPFSRLVKNTQDSNYSRERDHQQMREWFEKHALPKAVRIGVAEALRTFQRAERRAQPHDAQQAWAQVGAPRTSSPPPPLTPEELAEYEQIRRELVQQHAPTQ